MHSKFSDLAYELYQDDDVKGAINLYRKAVKEGDFLANMEIARIYIENPDISDFNELIACLKTVAISSYYERFEASYELAKIYLEKNDVETALKYSRKIKSIDKYSDFVNKIKNHKNYKSDKIKQQLKNTQHNSSTMISKNKKSKGHLEKQTVEMLRGFSNISQYNEIKQLIEELGHNIVNEQRMSRLNLLMAESYYYGDNGAERNLVKAAEFCKLSGVKNYLYYSLLTYIENTNRKSTEDDASIPEKEDISISSRVSNKKSLLIFDFDGTIFDTDFLRIKRFSGPKITDEEFRSVKYVKNFKENILNALDSNNDSLIITSSPRQYVETILNYHPELKEKIKYPIIYSHKKISSLREFLNKYQNNYFRILAFGDDEKDAFIYSSLKIGFMIANNYNGYSNMYFDDLPSTIFLNTWRTSFLCDVVSCKSVFYQSKYIDDIVIYYKNYYDPHSDGNVVSIYNISPRLVLKGYEFNNDKKREYIKNHLEGFIDDFRDLYINSETVLLRIPGHAETIYDKNNPISLLIIELINRNKTGINGSQFLHRFIEVEESKNGARYVEKDLNSIIIKDEHVQIIKGKTCYVFDDIATRGSSLIAATQLLYEAGAAHVVCFCLARTTNRGDYLPKVIE